MSRNSFLGLTGSCSKSVNLHAKMYLQSSSHVTLHQTNGNPISVSFSVIYIPSLRRRPSSGWPSSSVFVQEWPAPRQGKPWTPLLPPRARREMEPSSTTSPTLYFSAASACKFVLLRLQCPQSHLPFLLFHVESVSFFFPFRFGAFCAESMFVVCLGFGFYL